MASLLRRTFASGLIVAGRSGYSLDLHEVAAWLAPHRHAWYALPIVMLAFVALALVPVMLLIAATGIAFGPVLGPAVRDGRMPGERVDWLRARPLAGPKRVEQLGGERVTRVTRGLKRNGTLAVFLVRKVPAPFALVNVVIGASAVGYREFIIGTVLGMGAIVVALAGFGYQLPMALASVAEDRGRRGTVPRRAADAGVAHQPGVAAGDGGGMIGAPDRVAVAGQIPARSFDRQPGRNCWRVERARRFHCVQDAADYFRLVRRALLDARHTVFILGWDIMAAVDLLPGANASDAPTRLDELLAFVVRRRPQLRCYLLIWDHAALYTLERDPLSRWRLGWRMPRQVRFGFDDRHPIGGSHHQKIVVVDDQLAFCGGIDLTGHRWDTSAHRVDEPARTTPLGGPYGPYHEIQAMVDGPVAARLGVLARDRWRALGEEKLPTLAGFPEDLWPPDVTPDLVDVDVAIARTFPASETQPGIRECEALFLDSIAAAKRAIYIESQYFTNDMLGAALATRLREPDGPEVLVVTPQDCHGWLERSHNGRLSRRASFGN